MQAATIHPAPEARIPADRGRGCREGRRADRRSSSQRRARAADPAGPRSRGARPGRRRRNGCAPAPPPARPHAEVIRVSMASNRCETARATLARSGVESRGAPSVADWVAGRRRRHGFELIVDPHAEQVVVFAQPGELPAHRIPRSTEIADHDDQRPRSRDPTCAGQRIPTPSVASRSLISLSTPARTRKNASAPRRPLSIRDSAAYSPASTSPPTRSPFATAAHASNEAASAATTDLNASRVPNRMCSPRSTTKKTGAVALLLEELGMDPAGARGHPPVDAADVVAGQVNPRLRVFHPATPEPRYARPGPTGSAGAMCIQGEAGRTRPQADEIGGGERHPCQPAWKALRAQGTATIESSASTTRSASMPSASASKLSSTPIGGARRGRSPGRRGGAT